MVFICFDFIAEFVMGRLLDGILNIQTFNFYFDTDIMGI